MTILSADTLAGNPVKNPADEDLGEIKAIMLDVEMGRISYAVLDFGGFLGVANKLFAIPWEALTLNTAKKCFILDINKDTLEAAEGFDQDDWPDFANQEWNETIYNYYGYKPYW